MAQRAAAMVVMMPGCRGPHLGETLSVAGTFVLLEEGVVFQVTADFVVLRHSAVLCRRCCDFFFFFFFFFGCVQDAFWTRLPLWTCFLSVLSMTVSPSNFFWKGLEAFDQACLLTGI
jgi:hypothetical protein